MAKTYSFGDASNEIDVNVANGQLKSTKFVGNGEAVYGTELPTSGTQGQMFFLLGDEISEAQGEGDNNYYPNASGAHFTGQYWSGTDGTRRKIWRYSWTGTTTGGKGFDYVVANKTSLQSLGISNSNILNIYGTVHETATSSRVYTLAGLGSGEGIVPYINVDGHLKIKGGSSYPASNVFYRVTMEFYKDEASV